MKRPLLSAFLLLFSLQLATAAERPNVLLILLDDAGWTDVGWNGSRIQTPHIDRLAAEGMRFTDCHSAAPNCSPSRAGLLTGRIPPRVGIYSYLPADHVMHLRAEEITLAELLKDEGYHTGHFGKWHLSRLESDQPGPAEQGFDYSLGTDNNASPSHLNPKNFIRNGKPVGPTQGYSCQIVVTEANTWLDGVCSKQHDKPFFACVWFHEPHTPIASPPEVIAKYQKLYPELTKKQATYHANVENADNAIGRLIKKLEDLNVLDDTLIYFTSDNGPLNKFSRVGLRGQKSNVWEGGHRVPGVYRWPSKIAANSVCDESISGVDFLPTVCDFVGIDAPKDRHLDGQSLRPLLVGDQHSFERTQPLYWFFYRLNPALAIRDGKWSLIANTNDANRLKAHRLLREDLPHIRNSVPVDFQLFNVRDDLRQQTELSKSEPETLERLKHTLSSLHRNVIAEGHQWDIPAEYGAGQKKRIWPSAE